MRNITHIVVHCTATPTTATVEAIQRYWHTPKANKQTGATSPYIPNVQGGLGWKDPGYHYIIDHIGEITKLQDEDKPSNGVAGYNSRLINVAYIGGVDTKGKPIDNRTLRQKAALIGMLKELRSRYPHAIIQGHRDFPGVKKACPSFDAKTEYQNI